MAEENGRVCAVCGKALTGRQELYCSKQCKKKAERKRLHGEQPDAKYTKVCPTCGHTFLTDKRNRKYCCDECAKEWNRTRYAQNKREEKKKPIIICAVCGKEFEGKSAQAKYCSKECRAAAMVEYRRERRAAIRQTPEGREKLREQYMRSREAMQRQKREGTLTKKICQHCGKEFVADGKRRKYCSDECVKEQYKIQHRAQISRYRRKKRAGKKNPIRICAWCGKEFEGRSIRAKYCCNECRDLAQAARAREKHPKNKEVKEVVVQRQKKERTLTKKICAICGKEFEAKNPVTKYCSDECREAAEKGKEALMDGARTSDRICVICGKPLPAGRRQFCSDECWATAAKLKRRKNRNKDRESWT